MTDEMLAVICPCQEDKSQHEPEPTAFYLYASDDGEVSIFCSHCGNTIEALGQAA